MGFERCEVIDITIFNMKVSAVKWLLVKLKRNLKHNHRGLQLIIDFDAIPNFLRLSYEKSCPTTYTEKKFHPVWCSKDRTILRKLGHEGEMRSLNRAMYRYLLKYQTSISINVR